MQQIHAVTVLVRDYDEALAFYVGALGFDLIQDDPIQGTPQTPGKRWVLVAPPASNGTRLLLARADSPEQQAQIGNQCGGRVWLFLHTDDFWRDHRRMCERGVSFCETPREEPYGTVAVFEDLYGNRWDLLQPKAALGR